MNDDKSLFTDHEVKLKVMEQLYDDRFKHLEESIKDIEDKLNKIIGYLICSIVIPIVMHGLHFI